MGLSTSGSISLGCALVAGKKRVPNPAAGNTALRTRIEIIIPVWTVIVTALGFRCDFGARQLFQDCANRAHDLLGSGCRQREFQCAIGSKFRSPLRSDELRQLAGINRCSLFEFDVD